VMGQLENHLLAGTRLLTAQIPIIIIILSVCLVADMSLVIYI